MKNIFICPYNLSSKSALSLAKEMNVKRIKRINSKYVHSPNNYVICWGSTDKGGDRIINPGNVVSLLTNKINFFNTLLGIQGINQVTWTTNKNVASTWDGKIVERHTVTGNGGKGIQIKDKNTLSNCLLYTKYIEKKHEYRVHMIGDEVVKVQRKGIKRGTNPLTWLIRSHGNGFIFINEDNPPLQVLDQVKKVHKVFQDKGLTFAAYDVIYNEMNDKAYVLEGNSAPGIEGSTIKIYANKLKEYINKL